MTEEEIKSNPPLKNIKRKKSQRKKVGKKVNKTVRNIGLLGIGLYAEAEEKIQAYIDKLVEDGEISKEEGKKYLGEVKEASKKQKQKVSKKLEKSKDITKKHLKELEEKIRSAEKRLEKAEKKIIKIEDDETISGKSTAQMRNAENVRRAYEEERKKELKPQEKAEEE